MVSQFALIGGLVTICALFSLARWRWGIYALIVYFPFSGLPTILFYPAPTWTRIIKDVLFIAPAYCGFIIYSVENLRRPRAIASGIPIGWILLLAALVVLHLFNSAIPNFMVGLIGLKTWIFYLPMMFVGFYLPKSTAHLFSIFRLMVLTAMFPVICGLLQAALYYSGRPDKALAVYGWAADGVTQNFTRFSGAGGEQGLVRLPGIFTFVTQYFLFLLAMVPAAYLLALRPGSSRASRCLYSFCLGLILMAAFACGARAAFVIVPGVILLTVLIGSGIRRMLGRLLLFGGLVAVGFAMIARIMGGTVGTLFDFVTQITGYYLAGPLFENLVTTFQTTWIGLGTGMATGPAHFAYSSLDEAVGMSGGVESYYAKALYELGFPGLVALGAIFWLLLWRGTVRFRHLRDPSLRLAAAALLGLLVVLVVYLIKGALLDYDPLNVYFWLFAGILLALPRLDRAVTATGLSRPAVLPTP
jgi:hypothetical protein